MFTAVLGACKGCTVLTVGLGWEAVDGMDLDACKRPTLRHESAALCALVSFVRIAATDSSVTGLHRSVFLVRGPGQPIDRNDIVRHRRTRVCEICHL